MTIKQRGKRIARGLKKAGRTGDATITTNAVNILIAYLAAVGYFVASGGDFDFSKGDNNIFTAL